jgi:hypothetical protein
VRPDQLGPVVISGDSATLPALGDAVHAATGHTPTLIGAAPYAMADGALLATAATRPDTAHPADTAAAAGTAASSRLPRTRLRAADLIGVLTLSGCSAMLLLQAAATAWTHETMPPYATVYLPTEQVAAAAAIAAVAALAVAHLAPTVWLSGTPPDPATEPTTGTLIRNAYLTAAVLAVIVAALQGMAVGISYGHTFLTPALTAALPAAAAASIIAVVGPRIRTVALPTWQTRARAPIAWITLATAGIALARSGIGGGFPVSITGLPALLGAAGATLLGVTTVLTATRQPLIRLIAAPILGLGYATVYSVATAPMLVIGYLIALGWWILTLTSHTLRAAYPTAGSTLRRLVDGQTASGPAR